MRETHLLRLHSTIHRYTVEWKTSLHRKEKELDESTNFIFKHLRENSNPIAMEFKLDCL